ncbi:MAG: hypothetical protein M1812_003767 [Candelaria pacifica]|nr:MAG: hypothetical protein M1812_003767 [Candelaria pacifica]
MVNFVSLLSFTILAFFASAALGSPLEARATNTSALNTTQEYLLRTQVIYGGPYRFNGLYLSAYHTGAGLNDATLVRDNGIHGFINDTHQEFDLGSQFPWGLTLATDTNYAGWQFVYVNAGLGSNAMAINGSGLVQTYGQFGGWLGESCRHPQILNDPLVLMTFHQPATGGTEFRNSSGSIPSTTPLFRAAVPRFA